MQSNQESQDSLYTPEVRNYIRSRDWPIKLQYQIVEYPDYLQFVLFRDNFGRFGGETRKNIAMMVKEIMEKIRESGIPIYLEVAKTLERTESDST